MSRSWSSAHDWKSCRGQKLLESANLSIAATSLRTTYRSQRLFAKVTSHSFCRSSSPNRTRLRWASIRFFITALGIFLLTFPMPEQSPLCFDAFLYLYLRLKIRLASLPCFSFLRRIPRMCLGGLFKLRIACYSVFLFRQAPSRAGREKAGADLCLSRPLLFAVTGAGCSRSRRSYWGCSG